MDFQTIYAVHNDLKQISELFAEILQALPYYNAAAKKDEQLKYQYSELVKKLSDDPLSIIVVKDVETVVGFCFSKFDDYVIWLEWFAVHKAYRRQKIGSLLLQHLEVSALKRSCHKIWCDSRTENLKSKSVLEENNFQLVTRIDKHWYKQDFFIWQKFLK